MGALVQLIIKTNSKVKGLVLLDIFAILSGSLKILVNTYLAWMFLELGAHFVAKRRKYKEMMY